MAIKHTPNDQMQTLGLPEAVRVGSKDALGDLPHTLAQTACEIAGPLIAAGQRVAEITSHTAHTAVEAFRHN